MEGTSEDSGILPNSDSSPRKKRIRLFTPRTDFYLDDSPLSDDDFEVSKTPSFSTAHRTASRFTSRRGLAKSKPENKRKASNLGNDGKKIIRRSKTHEKDYGISSRGDQRDQFLLSEESSGELFEPLPTKSVSKKDQKKSSNIKSKGLQADKVRKKTSTDFKPSSTKKKANCPNSSKTTSVTKNSSARKTKTSTSDALSNSEVSKKRTRSRGKKNTESFLDDDDDDFQSTFSVNKTFSSQSGIEVSKVYSRKNPANKKSLFQSSFSSSSPLDEPPEHKTNSSVQDLTTASVQSQSYGLEKNMQRQSSVDKSIAVEQIISDIFPKNGFPKTCHVNGSDNFEKKIQQCLLKLKAEISSRRETLANDFENRLQQGLDSIKAAVANKMKQN